MSLKSPEVSHRKVVVLLLAPCHSFPGFGLLPSLIERTGWTVQLFSPDCSPSVRIPSSTFCKDDTCPAQDARADAGAEVRTESESVAVGGTMTESKRFESDPALFLSSIGLSDAHYAITFNSFHDVIWPLLSKEGFRPVSPVRFLVTVCGGRSRQILPLLLFLQRRPLLFIAFSL